MGLTSQAIAAQATLGERNQRGRKARAAIAKAFERKTVHVLRNTAGRICIFTDEQIPNDLKTMGLVYECQALVEWADDSGAIMLKKIETEKDI